jgi:hypothetical protein
VVFHGLSLHVIGGMIEASNPTRWVRFAQSLKSVRFCQILSPFVGFFLPVFESSKPPWLRFAKSRFRVAFCRVLSDSVGILDLRKKLTPTYRDTCSEPLFATAQTTFFSFQRTSAPQ